MIMVTKLIKSAAIVGLIFSSTLVCAQGEKYTVIPIDSIMIGSFKYGEKFQDFIEYFGSPQEYKEYSDPYPIEGYGKSFYLLYDSLSATFVEFYGEKILSNITIKGQRCNIKVGDILISIGSSVEVLKSFKESYYFYIKQYQDIYENKESFFYINLLIKNVDYEFFGLLNIKLKKNKIVEISFRFDEGA